MALSIPEKVRSGCAEQLPSPSAQAGRDPRRHRADHGLQGRTSYGAELPIAPTNVVHPVWRKGQRREIHAGAYAARRPAGHAQALSAGDPSGSESGGGCARKKSARSRANPEREAARGDGENDAYVISREGAKFLAAVLHGFCMGDVLMLPL